MNKRPAVAALALSGVLLMVPGTAFAQSSLMIPTDGGGDVPVSSIMESETPSAHGEDGNTAEDSATTSESSAETTTPATGDEEGDDAPDGEDSGDGSKLTVDFVESQLEDRGDHRFFDTTCGLGEFIDSYKEIFESSPEECQPDGSVLRGGKVVKVAVSPNEQDEQGKQDAEPTEDNKPAEKNGKDKKPADGDTAPTPEEREDSAHNNKGSDEERPSRDNKQDEVKSSEKPAPSSETPRQTSEAPTSIRTPEETPAQDDEQNDNKQNESEGNDREVTDKELKKQVKKVSKEANDLLNRLNSVSNIFEVNEEDAVKYVDLLTLLSSLDEPDNPELASLVKNDNGVVYKYLADNTDSVHDKKSTVDLVSESEGLVDWLASIDDKYAEDGDGLVGLIGELNDSVQGGK